MGSPPPELQWHLLFWTWWYSKLGTGLENTSKGCYFGSSSCRWSSNIPLSYSAMSLLLIASGIQFGFLFSLNMAICWTRIVEMQLGLAVFFFFFFGKQFSAVPLIQQQESIRLEVLSHTMISSTVPRGCSVLFEYIFYFHLGELCCSLILLKVKGQIGDWL